LFNQAFGRLFEIVQDLSPTVLESRSLLEPANVGERRSGVLQLDNGRQFLNPGRALSRRLLLLIFPAQSTLAVHSSSARARNS
jgi:hypothetical protein